MRNLNFTILVLAVLMLIGCGGGASNTNDPSGTPATTATLTSKELILNNQIPVEFATSVAVDTPNKILYTGSSSYGVKVIDTSANNAWLSTLDSARDLSLSQDKSYLYVINNASFLIYDVRDKNNISLVDSLLIDGPKALYITEDEKTAIIECISSGIYLVDISDKNNTKIVHNFDFALNNISASNIAVAKKKKQLFMIERTGIAPSETIDLKVYDISIPSNPLLLYKASDFETVSMSISHDETKLILSNYGVVQIADIRDINDIKSLFEYDTKSLTIDSSQPHITLSKDDNTVVLAGGNSLIILDITNINDVRITKATNIFQNLGRTEIKNNFIYVPDINYGLGIFSL